MHNNRLWLLMSRKLSGEASPAESLELENLLQEHPDKQYLLDILRNYFELHPSAADNEDIYFEEKFRKVITGYDAEQLIPFREDVAGTAKRIRLKKFFYYAAAISGISLLGWLAYHKMGPATQNPPLKESEVVAKPGARTKLVLPDGTQVWLNSGSKLNYQNDFNAKQREVELEGEAFFDVTKDVHRPFIVHAASINIKVVGTAFAVKSYPQDETVEATLLRGVIEVSRKDNPNAPKVILKPNEKLIFNKQVGSTASQNVVADLHKNSTIHDISVTAVSKAIPDSEKVETGWVYNRLVFDGDSFEELAQKMERWYNVKIIFKSENLSHYRFKGAFANETIREALNALQLTVKFSYQINDNEIEIYKK